MTDVRIWNVARSPSDIFSNMYTGVTGTETGLVLNWRNDQSEEIGQWLIDRSTYTGTDVPGRHHAFLGGSPDTIDNDPTRVVSDAPTDRDDDRVFDYADNCPLDTNFDSWEAIDLNIPNIRRQRATVTRLFDGRIVVAGGVTRDHRMAPMVMYTMPTWRSVIPPAGC